MNDFNIEILKSIDKFTLYKLLNSDSKLKKSNYTYKWNMFFNERCYKELLYFERSNYFSEEKRKYRRLVSKRGRIKADISRIIEKECIFLTLTFDQNHIDMLDKRRSVVRWLKGLKCNYIGNVDYGEENGRIHYHVIVQTDYVNYASYKYGAIDGERIKVKKVDALKRYIVKLTNHACKKSADREERILKCFKYD